jgi:serine/threonine protein kinase
MFKVEKDQDTYSLVVKDDFPNCETEVDRLMDLKELASVEKVFEYTTNEEELECISIRSFAPNHTVQRFLRSPENLKSLGDKLRFLQKLAKALQEIHEKNVLHLNLQPLNILVDAKQEPILTGFEDSRMNGSKGTASQIGYFAPPEFRKRGSGQEGLFTPAIDIFQLGVIAYYVFTSKLPFTLKLSSYENWIETPIVFNKGESFTLYEIVERCLTVPEKRDDDKTFYDFLQKKIQIPKEKYFPREYKYFMNQKDNLDYDDLYETEDSSNTFSAARKTIKQLESKSSSFLKQDLSSSQLENNNSIVSLKMFIILLLSGVILIVGIIFLICKRWSHKTKISKKFVKEQIKIKKKKKSKDVISLGQSLVEVNI